VIRTIFESQIPIVSGIGHETDVTISDMVADQRAPTPSAAAELITPDQNQWLQSFMTAEDQIRHGITRYLQNQSQKLDWLQKRLQHPGEKIKDQLKKIEFTKTQLQQAMQRFLKNCDISLKNAMRTLESVSPLGTLNRGYAIVFQKSGKVVRSIKDVRSKEELKITLKDGNIETKVSS